MNQKITLGIKKIPQNKHVKVNSGDLLENSGSTC